MDFKKAVDITENAIIELGVSIENARGQKKGQWNLYRGNLHVMVDIFNISDDKIFLQILVPLIKVPQDKETNIYKFLLEKNHTLISASLSIFKETVYLRNISNFLMLEEEAVKDLLNVIGESADEIYKILQTKISG
jgi:hypothetical protein